MANPTPADPCGCDYAQAIVETIREPLAPSPDLRVLRANRSFYRTFQVAPGETENRFLYDLGRGLRILAQRFDYRSLLGLLQTGGNE